MVSNNLRLLLLTNDMFPNIYKKKEKKRALLAIFWRFKAKSTTQKESVKIIYHIIFLLLHQLHMFQILCFYDFIYEIIDSN